MRCRARGSRFFFTTNCNNTLCKWIIQFSIDALNIQTDVMLCLDHVPFNFISIGHKNIIRSYEMVDWFSLLCAYHANMIGVLLVPIKSSKLFTFAVVTIEHLRMPIAVLPGHIHSHSTIWYHVVHLILSFAFSMKKLDKAFEHADTFIFVVSPDFTERKLISCNYIWKRDLH